MKPCEREIAFHGGRPYFIPMINFYSRISIFRSFQNLYSMIRETLVGIDIYFPSFRQGEVDVPRCQKLLGIPIKAI